MHYAMKSEGVNHTPNILHVYFFHYSYSQTSKHHFVKVTMPPKSLLQVKQPKGVWLCIDGLVQERHNSIANTLELRFSCIIVNTLESCLSYINPSISQRLLVWVPYIYKTWNGLRYLFTFTVIPVPTLVNNIQPLCSKNVQVISFPHKFCLYHDLSCKTLTGILKTKKSDTARLHTSWGWNPSGRWIAIYQQMKYIHLYFCPNLTKYGPVTFFSDMNSYLHSKMASSECSSEYMISTFHELITYI